MTKNFFFLSLFRNLASPHMGLVQCIKWGKELLTATGVTSYLLLGLLAQLKGSFETVDDLGATDRLLLETLVLNSVDIEDINVLL